jgi:hypothetical protein
VKDELEKKKKKEKKIRGSFFYLEDRSGKGVVLLARGRLVVDGAQHPLTNNASDEAAGGDGLLRRGGGGA